MKILAVDIGTGTQDILLCDTRLDLENSFKMVLPSPTMMVRKRIQLATRAGQAVLLTGWTMGGGPSSWAAEAHVRAGFPLFATPEAAKTFNDDLEEVESSGIRVISEDEAQHMDQDVIRLEMRDFDFEMIRDTLASFGVDLAGLGAVAVAVFDHGNAPAHVSDRQFRFDYIDRRIWAENHLSAFAYRAENIPTIMTRLQAVAASARGFEAPLVVMDTAPAAVLGARYDPIAAAQDRVIIANVGNFHTLAFRLGPEGIEGVFEHHTGLLDSMHLENLLSRLADGSLTHQEVFDSMGHGALVYSDIPLSLDDHGPQLIVTGPRRNLLQSSRFRSHFAVPFGDMMIAGCIGLLSATSYLIPGIHNEIEVSLKGRGGTGTAPWDID